MMGGTDLACVMVLSGVFQPAMWQTALNPLAPFSRIATSPRFSASLLIGVGHPVKPVSDVRGTDARSRERDRPEGVTQGFQVILYKVDPSVCVFACNLLTKDCDRAALLDEVVERWP